MEAQYLFAISSFLAEHVGYRHQATSQEKGRDFRFPFHVNTVLNLSNNRDTDAWRGARENVAPISDILE